MAVLGGVLAGIFLVFGVVVVAIAFQSVLLRLVARWAADVQMGWGMAIITTVVAAFVQGCASGIVAGGDAGIIGLVVGFAVWSGTVAVLNQLEFAKAALIGVVMAVVQWVITLIIVLAGLGALLGGAIGLAALSQ
jgi:hypothetical protein